MSELQKFQQVPVIVLLTRESPMGEFSSPRRKEIVGR